MNSQEKQPMNGDLYYTPAQEATAPRIRSAGISRRLQFLGMSGILVTGISASAENWAHWRGPHFDGSTTETKLPVEFSRTENVKWSASLPGTSAATAIIQDD